MIGFLSRKTEKATRLAAFRNIRSYMPLQQGGQSWSCATRLMPQNTALSTIVITQTGIIRLIRTSLSGMMRH
jgi:hypothetical protein